MNLLILCERVIIADYSKLRMSSKVRFKTSRKVWLGLHINFYMIVQFWIVEFENLLILMIVSIDIKFFTFNNIHILLKSLIHKTWKNS